MRLLFIGGTGNISLAASRRVLEAGHELWLLNRSGVPEALSGARSIRGDIGEAGMRERLRGLEWDVVVNWVAFTPADIERDASLFVGRTGQYVFISSASCYRNPGPTPFITERTPLENPFWQYARDKIAAESALQRLGEERELGWTVVRPSHTYDRVLPLTLGGWREYNAVERMKRGQPVVVQGDGTSLWTLTHAEDFAKGFLGLLGNPAALGEAYHITSDEFLSWNEIYQLTAKALGVEARIAHVTSDRICQLDPDYRGTLLGDKAVSALFDNSKIKQAVPDFRCAIGFAEGIARTLAWFEADPARQVVNPRTEAFLERLLESAR